MRQLTSKYRWMTAIFCLITMLSAFTVIGASTQKLIETSEQVEFEECEELLETRRQRISLVQCNLAHPNKACRKSTFRFLLSKNSFLKPQHPRRCINGCGSYLIT